MCGLLFWSRTRVDALDNGDVQVFGKANFQAIPRIGLVAGTAHRNDCLLEGISSSSDFGDFPQPTVDPQKLLAPLATALRARGFEVTVTSAGPLATHEARPDQTSRSDRPQRRGPVRQDSF